MNGRIDNAKPSAVFYFDGLRGEVISINLQITGGDLDPVLTVVRNREMIRMDDGNGSRVPNIPALRIPRTDRYYVTVGRFGYALGTTSGGFKLDIQRVGVSSASGSMLRYGDQVINSISDIESTIVLQFQGAARRHREYPDAAHLR